MVIGARLTNFSLITQTACPDGEGRVSHCVSLEQHVRWWACWAMSWSETIHHGRMRAENNGPEHKLALVQYTLIMYQHQSCHPYKESVFLPLILSFTLDLHKSHFLHPAFISCAYNWRSVIHLCVSVHETPGWCERGRGHGGQESSSAGEEAAEREGSSGEETTAGAGPGAEEGSCTVRLSFWLSACVQRPTTVCIYLLVSWFPSLGWKRRKNSRRRTTRGRGGNTSRMSIWGGSSSNWWRTWTRSSSLDLEVSRKSRGPSPSTETSWSRRLLPREQQVSNATNPASKRTRTLWRVVKRHLSAVVAQVCVLEASRCPAFLWHLSIWPTMTEMQITGRITGKAQPVCLTITFWTQKDPGEGTQTSINTCPCQWNQPRNKE